MKLTHNQLIHARDCQLRVLGITRKLNAGWLKAALRTDFDPDLVEAFHAADTRAHQPTRDTFQTIPSWLPAQAKPANQHWRIAGACAGPVESLAETLKHGLSEAAGNQTPEEYANRIYNENRADFAQVDNQYNAIPVITI